MKHLIAAALILGASTLALAQNPTADTAHKAHSEKSAKAKAKPSASRTEIKSTAKNMAAGVEAAEAALSPEELALADRVHTGRIPCELGAYVTVTADEKAPGYFNVVGKGFKYRMSPVASRTGALRLEDEKAGAVWIQIANKSMLMNQKLGQRLADECMSPEQAIVADSLRKNPAPSLLDTPATALAK
ncbi:hypothetical protein [Curvibacter gracilis]|uniref:hypothetical protein n=1 Tax=Curvibacter gracilis TaxID=230310 RepID=UPI000483238E|nr:hypothetical protein [Curvibacter gracilis]